MAMAIELPKTYDPKQAQERWLAFWDERGYFHSRPDDANRTDAAARELGVKALAIQADNASADALRAAVGPGVCAVATLWHGFDQD